MLNIESKGEYAIQQKLETITVLGVHKPSLVTLQGKTVQGWTYEEATEELVVSNAGAELNAQVTLAWK
jgi:alpha-glucosidase